MLMRAGLLDRLEKDFRVFADAGSVLIGVSGGPDSMALLRLALLWAEAPGRPRIVAATVDHGLRPDSAAEAAQVANWCAALGVPHRVLCWEGEKPAARIQERARDARYRLLVDHTGVEGCDTLFTAHHMDDQAETVLIRMARGSGVSGLAAMRPVVLREGVRHGRPLLGWRKEELIRICAESGQPYFTDPSNANPRYARTRLRTLAPTLADAGLDARVLSKLADRAARADDAIQSMAAKLLDEVALAKAPSEIRLDGARLLEAPAEIAIRLLSSCIASVGAAEHRIRLERLERVAGELTSALVSGAPFARTLAGALIRLKNGRIVTISPEPLRRRGRVMVDGISRQSAQDRES